MFTSLQFKGTVYIKSLFWNLMIGKCEDDVLADTILIPDTANHFCNQNVL